MSDLTPNKLSFVDPIQKVTQINTNVVAGYATSRWQIFPFTDTSVPTSPLFGMVATVRNTGSSDAVVKFQEADDVESSGVRYKLDLAKPVKAGGFEKFEFQPARRFIEIKSVEGNTTLNVALAAYQDVEQVDFSYKTDTNYPEVLWKAEPTSPTVTVTESFTSNTTWSVTHDLGFIADVTLLDSDGNDITALATISSVTTTGYVATFDAAQAGRAISSK